MPAGCPPAARDEPADVERLDPGSRDERADVDLRPGGHLELNRIALDSHLRAKQPAELGQVPAQGAERVIGLAEEQSRQPVS